jgi:hypothetical protein
LVRQSRRPDLLPALVAVAVAEVRLAAVVAAAEVEDGNARKEINDCGKRGIPGRLWRQ